MLQRKVLFSETQASKVEQTKVGLTLDHRTARITRIKTTKLAYSKRKTEVSECEIVDSSGLLLVKLGSVLPGWIE